MTAEITQSELVKLLEEKKVRFVGSVSEEQAKKLSKKYILHKTQNSDIVADVFGFARRLVAVYERVDRK